MMANYILRWRNITPIGPTFHTDWSPLQPQSKKQNCRIFQISSYKCLSGPRHAQAGWNCQTWMYGAMLEMEQDDYLPTGWVWHYFEAWRSLYSAGLRGSYESATDLALAQALIFWNSMSSSQYCRVQHGLEVTSYAMLPCLLRSSFSYRLSANLQAKIRYPLRIRSFFLVELISLPPSLVFEGFHFGKR